MCHFIIGRRIPWGNNNPKEIDDNNGFEEQTKKKNEPLYNKQYFGQKPTPCLCWQGL